MVWPEPCHRIQMLLSDQVFGYDRHTKPFSVSVVIYYSGMFSLAGSEGGFGLMCFSLTVSGMCRKAFEAFYLNGWHETFQKASKEGPNVARNKSERVGFVTITVWVIVREDKHPLEHLSIVHLKWISIQKPRFWPSIKSKWNWKTDSGNELWKCSGGRMYKRKRSCQNPLQVCWLSALRFVLNFKVIQSHFQLWVRKTERTEGAVCFPSFKRWPLVVLKTYAGWCPLKWLGIVNSWRMSVGGTFSEKKLQRNWMTAAHIASSCLVFPQLLQNRSYFHRWLRDRLAQECWVT